MTLCDLALYLTDGGEPYISEQRWMNHVPKHLLVKSYPPIAYQSKLVAYPIGTPYPKPG